MSDHYTGPERRKTVDYLSQVNALRLSLTCCIGVVLLLGAIVASLSRDIYSRVEQVEHTLIEHDQAQAQCHR